MGLRKGIYSFLFEQMGKIKVRSNVDRKWLKTQDKMSMIKEGEIPKEAGGNRLEIIGDRIN